MFKKSFISRNILGITIIIILLLQLLIAFQGFDVCDDGFVLTFYQQIFDNPESVEYNFLYWFTGFIGGIWYKIYEDGGILWFRLLTIVINLLTFYLTYKLLEKYINKYFLLSALTMATFVNDYGYLTFYHNQLTALMIVLIISMLYRAIIEENKYLYFLTGIILSVNVFTRIPNAVLFILIFVIPYFCYHKRQSIQKSLSLMGIVIAGSLLGLFFVYALLSLLGQKEIMYNALVTIIDLGNTENSSHNFKDIFKAPLYNYYSILKEGIKLFIIIACFSLFVKYLFFNKYLRYGLFTVTLLLIIKWFNTHNIYPIYFMCLLGSFVTLFIINIQLNIKLISLMSLLTLLTVTLGTGGGILNSGYMAIWVGLPLFFYLINISSVSILEFKSLNLNVNWVKYRKPIKLFSLIIICSFLSVKAYNISKESYFDPGSRFHKTSSINNKLARYIYTTERRANIINELLMELGGYIEEGDYLMTYDNIPMIHFLTKTKPYMYNPWVWIYDYNSFEKKIKKAEKNIEVLPIVVQQKFESFYMFSEPLHKYMSVDVENTNYHSNERNAIMNSFLERNEYEIVWSNSYFNIYQSRIINKVK